MDFKSTLFMVITTLYIQVFSAVSFPLPGQLTSPHLSKRGPRSSSHPSQTDLDVLASENQAAAYLFQIFEEALLNDTEVLYQLQQVFFPHNGQFKVVSIPYSVSILVETITHQNTIPTSSSCSVANGNCVWSNIRLDWYPDYVYPEGTSTVNGNDLRQYVLSIHSKLRELEFVSWTLLQVLAEFGQTGDHELVNFTLKVARLDVFPEDKDVSQALFSLMTWLKAYARAAFNQQVERTDKDKGDIHYPDRESDIYLENSVIVLFVSLNIFITLMAGVFLRSFSSFLVRKATAFLKESARMLSMYWATALVFTVANLGCLGADLYAFQINVADGLDNVLYTKIFVVLFLLVTEPFVVYYTTRDFSAILNVPHKVVQALCCCFSNVYGSRFAHTIAVLNILWFLHRLSTAFILVLFDIVVSPAETFTIVTLIFSVLIITVFLTSYVLYTFSTPRKKLVPRTVCRVFCATVTGVLAIAVIVSFSLVYLILLENGLQTSGVGGFLLSLFPPFLFFSIGLLVQKFFRRKQKNKEVSEDDVTLSSRNGNVTKMAEYQQLEADSDREVRGPKGRRGLSIQVSSELTEEQPVSGSKSSYDERDEATNLLPTN